MEAHPATYKAMGAKVLKIGYHRIICMIYLIVPAFSECWNAVRLLKSASIILKCYINEGKHIAYNTGSFKPKWNVKFRTYWVDKQIGQICIRSDLKNIMCIIDWQHQLMLIFYDYAIWPKKSLNFLVAPCHYTYPHWLCDVCTLYWFGLGTQSESMAL